MKKAIEIGKLIYWVGANDDETELFEGLWPLPYGVSYNSYIIIDKKIALIDTVKESFFEEYLQKIKYLIADRSIDYLIVNHLEPDHSGAINLILNEYPNIKIIGNAKTLAFLKLSHRIDKNTVEVKDQDILDLGDRKLKFHLTPMIHWPETMMTYDEKDKILFSGDAFGGFGSLKGKIFDDQNDIETIEDEIIRYFSNIVGKYSKIVYDAIERLSKIDISIICATHGPVWRGSPQRIIDIYRRLSSHEGQGGAALIYGSMYGNTERIAKKIAEGFLQSDKKLAMHNISTTHPSFLLRDAWKYNGLILGAPAYDTGIFPLMDNFLNLIERKGLKKRRLGVFGDYGWSGGGVKRLLEFGKKVGFEIVEPSIEANFKPTDFDFKKAIELGKNIAGRLNGNVR